MNIPTLTPCPKPDCRTPVTHWHDGGVIRACHFAMRGEPCTHVGPACHAPRVTAPLHLPDVDTVARAIYESDRYHTTSWATQRDGVKDECRTNARAVLDLIAAHQPVWKRVEPGTLIKEGTRYRHECENGEAVECIAAGDFFIGNSAAFYVLRTATAPETKESIIREFAAELDSIYTERTAGDGTWMGVLSTLVSRLDALGGEDK